MRLGSFHIFRNLKAFFRSLLLIAFDVALSYGAMLGAVRWRHDFLNKPIIADIDQRAAMIMALTTLLIWIIMRNDRAIWRFMSIYDFRRLFMGAFFVTLCVPLILFLFFNRGENFPRSAPFIAGIVFVSAIIITRLSMLIMLNGDFRALFRQSLGGSKKAILIGPAIELDAYLKTKMRSKEKMHFNPVGLIETSGQYQGRSIRSVPVFGDMSDIKPLYQDITKGEDRDVQLISVDPYPDHKDTAALIKIATELGAPLARNTLDMGGMLNKFEAADLIGRDIRHLDISPVKTMFEGRKVLITGAGGSIGSELSQQIMALQPSQLSLLDNSEFNLYTLENRLALHQDELSDISLRSYICDVTDAQHMSEIFDKDRPDIVLHAAALKHVPLGERNPIKTLRTNILGTSVTLDMCEAFNVAHFVLISTDKAVEPINIMGASKRIVEMLTLARQALVPTMQAAAVRFGNVLASRGSVVNLFEEQIIRGGPVTVTDPNVNRYFMSVEEASALVLQAAAMGAPSMGAPPMGAPSGQNLKQNDKGGSNIYVLEMGEPVNIARLARQLIRLRGKVPDVDIEVRFTGLRAGEKISERLVHNQEKLTQTAIDGVLHFTDDMQDPYKIMRDIQKLLRALDRRARTDICAALKQLLPDFQPDGALDHGVLDNMTIDSRTLDHNALDKSVLDNL